MAKRIVILGAGESGAGAAVLAKKQGFDTFVSDMSTIKDSYKNMLNERGIEWEEGKHTESLILNADEVIKSPGIPNDAPMILKLKAQGTPIISEIEFAGRYTNAKMICITGSNGKTTTTSLIYHIFKKAGMNVGLAGNIGQSLAYQVAEYNYDYCNRVKQLPIRQHVQVPCQHCRIDEHHAGSSGPLRSPDAKLCGCKIPHYPEPDSGRCLHLLER